MHDYKVGDLVYIKTTGQVGTIATLCRGFNSLLVRLEGNPSNAICVKYLEPVSTKAKINAFKVGDFVRYEPMHYGHILGFLFSGDRLRVVIKGADRVVPISDLKAVPQFKPGDIVEDAAGSCFTVVEMVEEWLVKVKNLETENCFLDYSDSFVRKNKMTDIEILERELEKARTAVADTKSAINEMEKQLEAMKNPPDPSASLLDKPSLKMFSCVNKTTGEKRMFACDYVGGQNTGLFNPLIRERTTAYKNALIKNFKEFKEIKELE